MILLKCINPIQLERAVFRLFMLEWRLVHRNRARIQHLHWADFHQANIEKTNKLIFTFHLMAQLIKYSYRS